MLDALLKSIPAPLSHPSPWVTGAAIIVGLLFWSIGGKFSRGMLTLAMVAIGAFVGLRIPRWFGWGIDGAAVGVFGALVLGLAGYFLHRTWIAFSLATLCAIWAGIAVWIALGRPIEWSWPAFTRSGTAADLPAQIWEGFPPELRRNLPLAVGSGLAFGLLFVLLWPRLGRALLFSLLGLTFIVAIGLPGIVAHQPAWLANVPPDWRTQVGILGGLVLLGTVIQWLLIRREEPERSHVRIPADKTEPRQPSKPSVTLKPASVAPSRDSARSSERLPVPPDAGPHPLTSESPQADDRTQTSPPAQSLKPE